MMWVRPLLAAVGAAWGLSLFLHPAHELLVGSRAELARRIGARACRSLSLGAWGGVRARRQREGEWWKAPRGFILSGKLGTRPATRREGGLRPHSRLRPCNAPMVC